MTPLSVDRRLMGSRTCFLSSNAGPNNETRATVIGHNDAHENSLVRQLCAEYGWSLGHDLELLPPRSFVERQVA